MGTKVLLTGGSGFVGGQLAKLLVARGHEVVALVRRSSKVDALKALGVRIAVADLNTGDGLDEAVEGVELVQHVAGVTKARSEEDYLRGNAETTRMLASVLARQKRPPRLVVCSSLAAAGPARIGKPRTEDENPAPVSMYGRSKLAAEQAAREFSDRVPTVIVRPPIVYGPGDLTNLPPLMAMARTGVYLKAGRGPKHFSFVHVDDLNQALLAAAERGKTLGPDNPAQGIYFASDPNPYSWEDFCSALSRALGRGKPRVISVPDFVGWATGAGAELGSRLLGTVSIMNRDKAKEMAQEAWTCSPARAVEEIGFRPEYPLDPGLDNTVAWYRTQGMA
ncbi:MAG: NAD-dependent epimerase/dehydratase family protein [Myxococcaceae bacterium]